MRTVIRRHITRRDRGTIENVWVDDNGKVSHYTYTRPVEFTSLSSTFDPLEELFWDWKIERINGYLLDKTCDENELRFQPKSAHIIDAIDADVVEISPHSWQNRVQKKWGEFKAGMRKLGQRLRNASRAGWYELTRQD